MANRLGRNSVKFCDGTVISDIHDDTSLGAPVANRTWYGERGRSLSAQHVWLGRDPCATTRNAVKIVAVQTVCRYRHGGTPFPWFAVVFVEHFLLGDQLAIGGRLAREFDVSNGMAESRS